MGIEYDCGECQNRIRVGDEFAGRQARCPYCDQIQTVPASENPYRDDVPIPSPAAGNRYGQPPASGKHYHRRYNLASLGDRFLGVVIDYGFFILTVGPGAAFLAYCEANAPDLGVVAGIVAFVGMVAYTATQWTMIVTRGQSVGKRVMGTRIIQVSGGSPGFVHGVILRIWMIPLMTTCVCGVFQIPIQILEGVFVFSESRQCLHDLIASTLVIYDEEPTQASHNPFGGPATTSTLAPTFESKP